MIHWKNKRYSCDQIFLAKLVQKVLYEKGYVVAKQNDFPVYEILRISLRNYFARVRT